MYAIIKTGGKQYHVKVGDIIDIEKITGDAKTSITFDQVLMLYSGNNVKVGTPTLTGSHVKAEIVDQVKDKKVFTFKYKKRKNCRRTKGHRQSLSRVKILAIEGAK